MATVLSPTLSTQRLFQHQITNADSAYNLSRFQCPAVLNNVGATGSCTVNLDPLSTHNEEIYVSIAAAQTVVLDAPSGGTVDGWVNGVWTSANTFTCLGVIGNQYHVVHLGSNVWRVVQQPQQDLGLYGYNATNVGAKNGATVTCAEYGDAYIHQTVLTLASTPLTLNGGATNAISYGGVKIYDFPAGLIRPLGCVLSLTMAMDGTMSAYFNDDTPEGDLSVGSSIVNSAEPLAGTDLSDGDFIDAVAYTMSGYAVTTAVTGVTAKVTGPETFLNGTSSAIDANLNLTVDANEIDDDGGIILLVSGTIILLWAFVGDV